MCALTAGARGSRVVVIDHHDKAAAKILISGGGRCNFTNIGTTPGNFISANPHFCRSALSRYTPRHFLALVNKHGIAWHEKTLGQLFCDGSARQIVAMLLDECAAAGVEVRTGVRVSAVQKSDEFVVETSAGAFRAPQLVLATGGLSIPKMGATGFALEVARQFGLRVVTPKPGLVPVHAPAEEVAFYARLSGVAVASVATAGGAAFRESSLFTHRGLSGPAVLQASSYLDAGGELSLDLAPDVDVAAFLKQKKHERPKAECKTVLAEILPQRFAAVIAPEGVMAGLAADSMTQLSTRLKNWTLIPPSTEGYSKAEVMVGGIDTRDLSSKTMEAVKVRGLFAIGEAVDVTGWLGGYNFQWAWASGFAAGQAVVTSG